jgi:hypothetical protein
MQDSVQIKAVIPRELKRRAFIALAAREEKFSHWLRAQLESWLQDIRDTPELKSHQDDEPLARFTKSV